jgi:hypothetical protein
MKEIRNNSSDYIFKFKDIKFKDHQELDDYFKENLIEKESNDKYNEEYELLKSFDRAFICQGDHTEKCPFNPITLSPDNIFSNIKSCSSSDEE